MSGKIKETYCINVGEDAWCAVLGSHYPNFPAALSLRQAEAITDGEDMGSEPSSKILYTQRLCDQTNVQYQYVLVREPTCSECKRIRALMVEFARPVEEKACRTKKK